MNRKKNGKNGRKIGQANNALHGNRGHPIMPLSRKKWVPKSCCKFKGIEISDFLDIAPH